MQPINTLNSSQNTWNNLTQEPNLGPDPSPSVLGWITSPIASLTSSLCPWKFKDPVMTSTEKLLGLLPFQDPLFSTQLKHLLEDPARKDIFLKYLKKVENFRTNFLKGKYNEKEIKNARAVLEKGLYDRPDSTDVCALFLPTFCHLLDCMEITDMFEKLNSPNVFDKEATDAHTDHLKQNPSLYEKALIDQGYKKHPLQLFWHKVEKNPKKIGLALPFLRQVERVIDPADEKKGEKFRELFLSLIDPSQQFDEVEDETQKMRDKASEGIGDFLQDFFPEYAGVVEFLKEDQITAELDEFLSKSIKILQINQTLCHCRFSIEGMKKELLNLKQLKSKLEKTYAKNEALLQILDGIYRKAVGSQMPAQSVLAFRACHILEIHFWTPEAKKIKELFLSLEDEEVAVMEGILQEVNFINKKNHISSSNQRFSQLLAQAEFAKKAEWKDFFKQLKGIYFEGCFGEWVILGEDSSSIDLDTIKNRGGEDLSELPKLRELIEKNPSFKREAAGIKNDFRNKFLKLYGKYTYKPEDPRREKIIKKEFIPHGVAELIADHKSRLVEIEAEEDCEFTRQFLSDFYREIVLINGEHKYGRRFGKVRQTKDLYQELQKLGGKPEDIKKILRFCSQFVVLDYFTSQATTLFSSFSYRLESNGTVFNIIAEEGKFKLICDAPHFKKEYSGDEQIIGRGTRRYIFDFAKNEDGSINYDDGDILVFIIEHQ